MTETIRKAIDAFCVEHSAEILWRCKAPNAGIHDAFVEMLESLFPSLDDHEYADVRDFVGNFRLGEDATNAEKALCASVKGDMRALVEKVEELKKQLAGMVAAEREACAAIASKEATCYYEQTADACREIATMIRKRSESQ